MIHKIVTFLLNKKLIKKKTLQFVDILVDKKCEILNICAVEPSLS